MKDKTFENLPNWLQKLWDLDSELAGEAEMYLDGLGADIRNKLTPPKNLCALLKLPKEDGLKDMIRKEIKNTENSVDYLKNLL